MANTLMHARPSKAWRLLAVAVTLLAAGCSKPATVITGLVSLDGKPVPAATLEFFPASGKGRVSFAKTGPDGRYSARVWPAPLTVSITATKINGKVQDPYGAPGQMTDRVVNALPDRYGYQEKTPLVAEPVEGQTTTIDFALEASAK